MRKRMAPCNANLFMDKKERTIILAFGNIDDIFNLLCFSHPARIFDSIYDHHTLSCKEGHIIYSQAFWYNTIITEDHWKNLST